MLYDQAKLRIQDSNSSELRRQADEHGKGAPSVGPHQPPLDHKYGEAFGVGPTQGLRQDMSTLSQSQSQAKVGTSIQESAGVDDPKQKVVPHFGHSQGTSGPCGEGSKPNWQLIVDKAIGMKFTTFHKNKDGILNDTNQGNSGLASIKLERIRCWRRTWSASTGSSKTSSNTQHLERRSKIHTQRWVLQHWLE